MNVSLPQIRQLFGWAWFPWLAAAYPVLFLYERNTGLTLANEFWLVLGVTLVAISVLVGALFLVTRRFINAAAASTILAMGFFSMGHFWLLVVGENSALTPPPPQWLLPVWVAVTLGLAALTLFRASADTLKKAAGALNAACLLLVIFPSIGVVQFFVGQAAAPRNAAAPDGPPKVLNDAAHPDVYYIILDGYSADRHLLRDWGYDNSDFTNALRERGFYVADESTSNYGVTLASMASSLNMRYLEEDEKPASDPSGITYSRMLIADSEVARQFQARGYTYVFVMSGFDRPSTIADVNVDFWYSGGARYYPKGEVIPEDQFPSESFIQAILKTTILIDPRIAPQRTWGEVGNPNVMRYDSPQRALHTWRQGLRIAERPEATFAVIHVIKPHVPISFDRDGNIVPEAPQAQFQEYYFDQLKFVNKRTLEIIDGIKERSNVPPIIILQGDHGSRLGIVWDEEGRSIYFEILNAYHFPGGGADALYPTISPVNSFRLLFNAYFDGDYDLLPDDHQYEAVDHYNNLFVFEEIEPDK